MKKIYKSILLGAIALIATMFNWSCDKNDSESGGTPYISYVRVTKPGSADSLLVAAGQGQLIAIVGGNLQTTKEIWFNDQKASLTPTYITNTTILVHMPKEIPTVVTNQMKLIFANGDSLLYPFKLVINPPSISSMTCEYVADGDSAVINGGYFYLPVTVTFPSVEGSIVNGLTVSSETGDVVVNTANNKISVKVPEGAKPGQIIVASNFGKAISNFWFRDNRNILEGFDGSNDPGTNGTVISNPGAGDPPLINGKYTRVINPAMGSWNWTQVYARWSPPYCPIPDAAILHPNDYYFKFEVCTTKPFDANGIRVWVTDPSVANATGPKGDGSVFYNWMPPFDTQGKWQTVTIPFEDLASALQSWFPGVTADGTYFSAFVYCEAGTLNCDMSYDNFRIVPKAIIKPSSDFN